MRIVKTTTVNGSILGSDIIALGADSIIVKTPKSDPAQITVNPDNESESIIFTYNDVISVEATDVFLFRKETQVAFGTNGGLNAYLDASFSVETNETLVCPDVASPGIFTTLNQIKQIRGFEIDQTTASVKNVTGRSVTMTGSMAVQLEQTGNQNATFFIASEKSTDGINWTYNPESLRVQEIAKDGVDYMTIPSLNIGDWNDGEYIRWVFAKTGTGGVTLSQPSQLMGVVNVLGQTFVWSMSERIRT